MAEKFKEFGTHEILNYPVDDLGPLADDQFLSAAQALNNMIQNKE